MSSAHNRLDERKRKTHERIIKAAVRHIERDGLESLSLERVAEIADISRATLFNHMHTREELLIEALGPVFDDCIAMLEGLHCSGAMGLGSIADACVCMWKQHKGVICRPGSGRAIASIPALEGRHERLVSLFIGLFESLPNSTELRLSDHEDAALLVFRTFIPILDSMPSGDAGISLFKECLAGLIVREAG